MRPDEISPSGQAASHKPLIPNNYLPRVLVVDDNPRLIPLLKRTVESGGFQVIFCTNGQQAWDYLTLNHELIDVVVTDIHMSILSGLELIRRIKKAAWDIPFIILSAQTQNKELQEFPPGTIQHILTKPHGIKDLPVCISHVLEARGKLYETRTQPAAEPDIPTILMVEDDPVFSLVMGDVLKKHVSARVFSCSTIQQANYLVESFALALLITDLNLPDGNSLALITSLFELQPQAQVVMITASRAPVLKNRAEALGLIRFLEKPIQPLELADLAESLLSPRKSQNMGTTTKSVVLGGINGRSSNLSEVMPLSDIRRRCEGNKTCTLTYSNALGTGILYLNGGKMIHAVCGKLTGLPALGEILTWDSAYLKESRYVPTPTTLPNRSWQSLLMEAFRYDSRMNELPPNQVGAHRWSQRA